MTEFDYDLFKSTISEEPSIFEGRHLVFCLYDAGRITELMQADYSETTWPDVMRAAEALPLRVSSTDNRFFVRVT